MAKIAQLITQNFAGPVSAIGDRRGPVDGAAVPKAAVEKNRHSFGCEDDVWPHRPSAAGSYRIVNAKAQTSTVKG
jgi:hypothetical protein